MITLRGFTPGITPGINTFYSFLHRFAPFCTVFALSCTVLHLREALFAPQGGPLLTSGRPSSHLREPGTPTHTGSLVHLRTQGAWYIPTGVGSLVYTHGCRVPGTPTRVSLPGTPTRVTCPVHLAGYT